VVSELSKQSSFPSNVPGTRLRPVLRFSGADPWRALDRQDGVLVQFPEDSARDAVSFNVSHHDHLDTFRSLNTSRLYDTTTGDECLHAKCAGNHRYLQTTTTTD
jgi:hypothetical protein